MKRTDGVNSTILASLSPDGIVNNNPISFGHWLRRRLGRLGVNISRFSLQASVARQTVHYWLLDRHPPSRTKVPALALLLGVTEAQLSKRIAVTWPHGADATAKASA